MVSLSYRSNHRSINDDMKQKADKWYGIDIEKKCVDVDFWETPKEHKPSFSFSFMRAIQCAIQYRIIYPNMIILDTSYYVVTIMRINESRIGIEAMESWIFYVFLQSFSLTAQSVRQNCIEQRMICDLFS